MSTAEVFDSKELRRCINRIEETVKNCLKKNNELATKILKDVSGYSALMLRMEKALEATEETLMNVLVAIRQQEHLQAWYPAQKGYPEMKVVGRHPSKYISKGSNEN